MTALDHPTHAIAAETRTVAAVARVTGGFRAFWRAFANRRALNRLGDLSDHELADIGLLRSDLFAAQRTPLGVDPTARLSDYARQRAISEEGARRVC